MANHSPQDFSVLLCVDICGFGGQVKSGLAAGSRGDREYSQR